MNEQDPSREVISLPPRLEYGAVPLDPWHATYPDDSDELYVDRSLSHIDAKAQAAMMQAVESDLVEAENAALVYEFMRESLYDSQVRRIDLNAQNMPADLLDPSDLRVVRAKDGTASPEDLFGLLVDNPKLDSLELAKLSHPFDVEATEVMDVAVYAMLEKAGGEMLDEPGRYKLKQRNRDIPARIVLRKQAISNHHTPNGTIQVVQRKSFLVRADEGASNDPYLGRLIKNDARSNELIEKIDGCYPYLDELPQSRLKWLSPQATSYYAKYLPEPENKSAL